MGLETVHVIWAWNHIEANVAETFLVKTIAQTVGIFNAVVLIIGLKQSDLLYLISQSVGWDLTLCLLGSLVVA